MAEVTHGRGFDVVLEAAGAPAAMAAALEIAALSARLVFVGIDIGSTAPAKLGLIQSKALRITGTLSIPLGCGVRLDVAPSVQLFSATPHTPLRGKVSLSLGSSGGRLGKQASRRDGR